MADPSFSSSPLNSPLATSSAPTPEQAIAKALGTRGFQPINDPAYAPKHDRLDGIDVRQAARIVTRELPITTVNTAWSIDGVRSAMQSLLAGLFDQPAQLIESMIGDPRVQAAMMARTGALLGSPISFKLPKKYKDDPIAKKCLRAWERIWPLVAPESVLSELQQWSVQLGFGIAQINWDTNSSNVWRPYLQVWNPRYTYYHWLYRCYIAIGQDGQFPVFGGDGHWLLHAPNGESRGWVRGAMRPIAPWWLARQYALRDWARYSERNGMPWVVGKTPAAADPIMIDQFRNALALLGQESVIQVPQGVDDRNSYGVELLDGHVADSTSGFETFIERCSSEITLALMGQNLTTEVKEGSLAAARVHADVKQQIIAADARALASTIYTQLARPFALFNFGDAKYAPVIEWDTTPPDDEVSKSTVFTSFAKGVADLRIAGYRVDNLESMAKDLGLELQLSEAPLPGVAAGDDAGSQKMPGMPGIPSVVKEGGKDVQPEASPTLPKLGEKPK